MVDSEEEQHEGTASTSFRWHYGGKEGRQVFALETTINGNPAEDIRRGRHEREVEEDALPSRDPDRAEPMCPGWRRKKRIMPPGGNSAIKPG